MCEERYFTVKGSSDNCYDCKEYVLSIHHFKEHERKNRLKDARDSAKRHLDSGDYVEVTITEHVATYSVVEVCDYD